MIFPLFSTKHVALRKTIAQEIAYHKQSIQHNQTNQIIESICLTIEMLWQERYGKGSWFVRYGFESLVGKDQHDWEKIGLGKYNWWSFYALSKHIWVLGIAHV